MDAARAFNILLFMGFTALVVESVRGIKVQHKADLPDVADRAHHGTGTSTRPRTATSPGIVSAVVKVKLTSSADAKHAACGKADSKCVKHKEWDSQESTNYSDEDISDEDDVEDKTGEQEKDTKTVKVVAGLDDSIEEEDYGKSGKRNEQNEISDVPIYSGSYVGVNMEEEYEDLARKEWNPRERLPGGHRHLENIPYHKYGEPIQFEYPALPIPVHYNVHGSIFEIPNGYKQEFHSSVPVARAPRPYHNLLTEYRKTAYPHQEYSMLHHQPMFSVQKHRKEILHVDDKIDFPKEKESLEDSGTTSTSSEISIVGKMYEI